MFCKTCVRCWPYTLSRSGYSEVLAQFERWWQMPFVLMENYVMIPCLCPFPVMGRAEMLLALVHHLWWMCVSPGAKSEVGSHNLHQNIQCRPFWSSVCVFLFLLGVQLSMTVTVTSWTLQRPGLSTRMVWAGSPRTAPSSLPWTTAWSGLLNWWGQTNKLCC